MKAQPCDYPKIVVYIAGWIPVLGVPLIIVLTVSVFQLVLEWFKANWNIVNQIIK